MMRAELKTILRPVDRDLVRVTERLLTHLQHPIARMAVYLITAGGKRLRPALVLLAGHSGKYDTRQARLLDLAAAIELVHTATLIHDDIIDGSLVRRQQPTFHQRWGTERAVLMGDYLYATAFSIFAKLQDAYVTSYMAKICQQMSRGEFQEVDSRYQTDLTEAEYLRIVRDKTACLIAASAHLGAYLAGAKRETVQRLETFGLNVGMAFQIMDDCLDLIGDERAVGKTLRSDLEKGCLSLPIIYLGHALSARDRETLFAPLRARVPNRRWLARVARAARRRGAIERALQTAQGFVRMATDALAERDGVVFVSAYHRLARYAIERAH